MPVVRIVEEEGAGRGLFACLGFICREKVEEEDWLDWGVAVLEEGAASRLGWFGWGWGCTA